MSDYTVQVVPRWKVANAIGAALARTTCEVNFFADTESGIAEALEENFSCRVDHSFDRETAPGSSRVPQQGGLMIVQNWYAEFEQP